MQISNLSMQNNNYKYNPHFDGIINKAEVAITKRLKNGAGYQKIEELIKSMSDSDTVAVIQRCDGLTNRLYSMVYNRFGKPSYYLEESLFNSVFCSPARFVKRVCKAMKEVEKR